MGMSVISVTVYKQHEALLFHYFYKALTRFCSRA